MHGDWSEERDQHASVREDGVSEQKSQARPIPEVYSHIPMRDARVETRKMGAMIVFARSAWCSASMLQGLYTKGEPFEEI